MVANGSIYGRRRHAAGCWTWTATVVSTLSLAHGVRFDLGDGSQGAARVGWVGRGDGLLVVDLNGNGRIDNGRELFGSASALAGGGTAANGFQALAQYDSNGDGQVDARDAAFATLRLWVDANADGRTDAGELQTLAQAGVASLGLGAQAGSVVEQGNLLGLTGSYRTADGRQRALGRRVVRHPARRRQPAGCIGTGR